MEENKDNNTYKPNFVMYDDSQPPADAAKNSEPANVSKPAAGDADTSTPSGDDPYQTQQVGSPYNTQRVSTPPNEGTFTGSFRDPRENFKMYTDRSNTSGYDSAQSFDTASEAFAHDTNMEFSGYGHDFEDTGENAYSADNFEGNDFGGGGEPPIDGNHATSKKRPPRRVNFTRKSLALLIAVVMVISILFGAGSAAVTYKLCSGNQTANGIKHNGDYTLANSTNASMSIADITEKTQKSVVEIRTESVSSDSWMRQYVTQGAGSGVIVSSDGYILTNNHVIKGARKITVTTKDGKTYTAKLVGSDTINDVAVLKINDKNLSAATYGNSDQLKVGDMAVAIGNPLGELGGTVTSGIISSLDRQLNIDGKTMTLLQTDASINPGNSGGGLFNDEGQLIGIVVAKSSGSDVEGLGFAIPINKAADVAKQLIDKGYVSGQPYTGMSYQEATQSSGQSGLDSFINGDQSSGAKSVYIVEVNGKHAKKAGFKAGDMVYAVNDKQITSFDQLSSIITSKKVGDKVKYTIVRDGKLKDISFELEEKGHE